MPSSFHKVLSPALTIGSALAFALAAHNARADGAVDGVAALPAAVNAVFQKDCPADNWIGGHQTFDGSRTATFRDQTKVYLMVCGDAASTVPYSVIVLSPAGRAGEATLRFVLHGRRVPDAALGNMHFGAAPDTIVGNAHQSATCEPTYTHKWDGRVFQLVALNRHGCRRGE